MNEWVPCILRIRSKQCTEHGTETIVLNGQSYHKGTRILKPTTLSILKISLIFASEH